MEKIEELFPVEKNLHFIWSSIAKKQVFRNDVFVVAHNKYLYMDITGKASLKRYHLDESLGQALM